jgi:tetratricopeptide (TPR) repeat protein
LSEFPDYVGALQTLGNVHLARKNYWPALSCFTKAAMRCPKDWINLVNLAAVYVGLEAPELATMTLDLARRLNPDDAEIYHTMGEIYRDSREYQLAVEAYTRAIGLDPNHAFAMHGLGESYMNLGRYAEAAAAHEKVHQLRPHSIGSLYGLAQLPPSFVHIDIMKALKKLKENKPPNDEDFRLRFEFTWAAVLDYRGMHKEAWQTLMQANKGAYSAHEDSYKKQLSRQAASRKLATDHPIMPTPQAVAAGTPISLFLMGLSRSGKTTLEYLVSALEGSKRGYESRLVERAIQRASQHSGLLTLSNPNDLPRSLDREFRKYYMDELKVVASKTTIFTNTNPGLIHSVGRVAAVLPNCRFVFVKRDKYDTAFRILGKKYKAGNHYAYDVKTVFDYITWYNEMIDLWCEKLPSVTRLIRYEDMIADPTAALKTVADLCGVQMPSSPLPELGDDRGCGQPYREMIDAELRS